MVRILVGDEAVLDVGGGGGGTGTSCYHGICKLWNNLYTVNNVSSTKTRCVWPHDNLHHSINSSDRDLYRRGQHGIECGLNRFFEYWKTVDTVVEIVMWLYTDCLGAVFAVHCIANYTVGGTTGGMRFDEVEPVPVREFCKQGCPYECFHVHRALLQWWEEAMAAGIQMRLCAGEVV